MIEFVYIKLYFMKMSHYKKLMVSNIFYRVIGVMIQLAVFTIYFSSNDKGQVYWDKTVLYLSLSSFLAGFVSLYRVPDFSERIHTGQYAVNGIKPVHYHIQAVSEEIGVSLILFLPNIFLLIACVLFSTYYRITIHWFFFLPSSLLSILVSAEFTTLVYSITIYTQKNNASKALLQGIASLLSGSLIPLFLWPMNIVGFIRYLPFAAVIDAPIEIALNGQYRLLFVQIFWCIMLRLVNATVIERILSKQQHIGG